MSMTVIVGLLGIVLIAAFGFIGRRRPVKNIEEWTVGGRNYGVLTAWVLQAGETFTTFTFLGTVGLVVSIGASAFYSIPYVPLAYIAMYWVGPKLWRKAKEMGYLTQADFLRGSYNSPTLGWLTAFFGILFLLPYLQLQITGLGIVISVATGGEINENFAIVLSFVLVIGFVLWSGIRGVALTSYLKDALMIVVVLGLTIVIPFHFRGGLDFGVEEVLDKMPEMLSVQPGEVGIPWVVSSMAISIIGVMFYALPHTWPALMSGRSEKVVRQNLIYLPIYNMLACIPMLLGYTAILAFGLSQDGDLAMLKMAAAALPDWLTGVVLVAAASTAMVPGAALLNAIAPLAVQNVFMIKGDRKKIAYNRIFVIVFGLGALVLALTMPNLLGMMLLLTYSGSTQVVPAIIGAVIPRITLHKASVISGLCSGLFIVLLFTFSPIHGPNINEGISGLAVNIVVLAIVEIAIRATRPRVPVAVPEKAEEVV
ncbi:sodium:solute symporter family protein [Brevibacterium renqingii]|uniref:sodium:solute symporter family protein n=1 Tax=Brevibacterium renqingii TaxID=2776916 RepID=UPI001ADFB30F|nr:sodium:solute symporter family protein [Brevibacterium renqingii]